MWHDLHIERTWLALLVRMHVVQSLYRPSHIVSLKAPLLKNYGAGLPRHGLAFLAEGGFPWRLQPCWRMTPPSGSPVLFCAHCGSGCMRLAVLHAVWCAAYAAGSTRHSGVPASARCVAARVLCFCRKLMLQHWFRVDIRFAALRTCPHRLLSRSPSLTPDQFQGWWCASRVLCCVTVPAAAGAGLQIAIPWGQRPVPLPSIPLLGLQSSALHVAVPSPDCRCRLYACDDIVHHMVLHAHVGLEAAFACHSACFAAGCCPCPSVWPDLMT